MASGDTQTKLTTLPLQTRADQQLRARAVLFEADQQDKRQAKAQTAGKYPGRQHQPILRALVLPDRWPLLAHFLATHPNIPNYDGWPPSVTRNSAPRLKQMNAMRERYGLLVLLRLTLSELDDLSLKSAELVSAARPLVKAIHGEVLRPGAPFVTGLQRGGQGSTHTHSVSPLSGLLPEYAEMITAARHGRGGGRLLLEGRGHGVVIDDTPQDFSRVARYTSRDPDSRLDTPDTELYFDALEAELYRKQNMQKGERSPRLSWKGSAPSKRLTPTLPSIPIVTFPDRPAAAANHSPTSTLSGSDTAEMTYTARQASRRVV